MHLQLLLQQCQQGQGLSRGVSLQRLPCLLLPCSLRPRVRPTPSQLLLLQFSILQFLTLALTSSPVVARRATACIRCSLLLTSPTLAAFSSLVSWWRSRLRTTAASKISASFPVPNSKLRRTLCGTISAPPARRPSALSFAGYNSPPASSLGSRSRLRRSRLFRKRRPPEDPRRGNSKTSWSKALGTRPSKS